MTATDTFPTKRPWHLWLIGIVTLLWNAMGAMDYTMTKTKNEAYMSAFSPEQLDYFYSFPAWVVAAWATAVWFSVIGSLLLLFRSRFAVPVFLISFIAMAITALHNFVLDDVKLSDIVGPEAIWFSLIIAIVTVLLVWYASAMRKRGVLR